MKKLIYLALLIFTVLFVSCNSSKRITRYTVASETRNCVGVGPQKCLLVKKGNQSDWEFFYSNIEGFNYVEGNEYVIDVKTEKRENVPADASSLKFILIKEISKIAKQSENLPQNIVHRDRGYELVGKVLAVKNSDIGRGAASGKINVTVVEINVTSSVNKEIKEGDIIFAELIESPRVMPVQGREYVFKARHKHPVHAKGMYLLEADVMDLIN